MEERFDHLVDSIAERGFGMIENFLTAHELEMLREDLLQKYQQDEFKKAGIGQHDQFQIERAIRGDYIWWFAEDGSETAQQVYLEKVHQLMAFVNRTCYLGLNRTEVHYALYPKGTFYKRHLDQFLFDDDRKLTVICYLNDNWSSEDGGQLKIYLPDGGVAEVLPLGGRLICFDSARLEHEVLLANRERLSITGWFKRMPAYKVI